MNAAAIVQVIAIAMALVLALRALRGRNMPVATIVRWGLIWAALIAAIALIVQHSGFTSP